MFSKHKQEHEPEMARYMDHVATGLRALPNEARETELEEIGQHLHALSVAHAELGLPKQEATRAALRQFGPSKQVARTLVRAWKRGQTRRLPGTLIGAVGWGVAATTVAILVNSLLVALLDSLIPSSHGEAMISTVARFALSYMFALYTGYITGRRAPRYALQGTFLVGLMFFALDAVIFYEGTLPHIPSAKLPMYLVILASLNVLLLGIKLLGARWGRRRYRATGRMRLAG